MKPSKRTRIVQFLAGLFLLFLGCAAAAGAGGGDRKVTTARFDPAPLVMAGTVPCQTLQQAFDLAESAGTVRALAVGFNESPELRRSDDVLLSGGYDDTYAVNPGWTTIQGSLTVKLGSLKVEQVVLGPVPPATVFSGLYITTASPDAVSVVDPAGNAQALTVPLPASPGRIALHPQAKRALVTTSSAFGAAVVVVDTGTDEVVTTIPVGISSTTLTSVTVDPSANKAYVTADSVNGASVFVIDTTTNSVQKSIDLAGTSTSVSSVAVHPPANRAYVISNSVNGASILVIDTLTDTVLTTIPVGISSTTLTAVAVDTPANRAYVAAVSVDGASLFVMDTSSEAVSPPIAVGSSSTSLVGLAVDTAGGKAYAIGNSVNGASVFVIDTTANSVTTSFDVGSPSTSATGIAVSPSARVAYVTGNSANGGALFVIDTAGSIALLRTTLPVAGSTTSVAVAQ